MAITAMTTIPMMMTMMMIMVIVQIRTTIASMRPVGSPASSSCVVKTRRKGAKVDRLGPKPNRAT